MSEIILVTGATGTVGAEVVQALAGRGLTVRAGVHSAEKGDSLRQRNPLVELVELDYARPDTVRAAFAGADRVFLLTPFSEDKVAVGQRLVDAAQQAGVRHVVCLSGAGADAPDEAQARVRISRWHRAVEEYLEQSGLLYTLLRPSGFLQNLAKYNAEAVRREGKLLLSMGDGRVSFIDARDIAAVAALVLTAPVAAHQGRAYLLTGPAAVGGQDIAAALGAATGRPVSYVDVPGAVAAQALAQAPAWMRESMRELQRLYKSGAAAGVSPTVEQLTQHPPRSLTQFAQDYQQAFLPVPQSRNGEAA
ncbi:SDR family oxidoreductase [Hymenobacter coccineus]|uniref:NmrA-like domain-containing protein n=1 Tax=Hymenobacter coccineus TaxID=1908235 RepID=A0A1G1TJE6_9BACT|nr:SDR family oxidoreductase [Hymenobacter coccineus]OGX90986.1 hypothetical protein BEN49_05760 [Hymenobacter coccineus]